MMDAIVTDNDYAGAGLGAPPKPTKSHKLLKTPVPTDVFYEFIKKISHKMPNSDYYLIDMSAYKKATYCEDEAVSLLQQFCNDLMPYYYMDKHFFLTRKMSFNNLNTILRQICRHNSIECKSERKYDKSNTHIVYHIYDQKTYDQKTYGFPNLSL